ncbi:hypothetical protein [Spirosoma foliorum]|uniref:START domain-containing protein n=1 Tax=Spirosoma foliorum TaxID=2710596 RepID=A0A7G5H0T9_9BACT|nr:hypothetical protein [Spirosoma foliorum]QMW04731.1 hypothetical protein H3H32_07325 [Spirosoma foliorum]
MQQRVLLMVMLLSFCRIGFSQPTNDWHLEKDKDGIRVVEWFATWEVRPQADKQLLIDYQCHVNPGGSLPTWLVNLTAANGPYDSFKLLRKTVQEARYQGHRYSFLNE